MKSASMPCSAQNAPISATDRSEAFANRTAASGPTSLASVLILGHHVIANPPFAPLAPAPQMSASSTPTVVSGAISLMCSAVHRPVIPPPTMHTSTCSDPVKDLGAESSSVLSACLIHQARRLPADAEPVAARSVSCDIDDHRLGLGEGVERPGGQFAAHATGL